MTGPERAGIGRAPGWGTGDQGDGQGTEEGSGRVPGRAEQDRAGRGARAARRTRPERRGCGAGQTSRRQADSPGPVPGGEPERHGLGKAGRSGTPGPDGPGASTPVLMGADRLEPSAPTQPPRRGSAPSAGVGSGAGSGVGSGAGSGPGSTPLTCARRRHLGACLGTRQVTAGVTWPGRRQPIRAQRRARCARPVPRGAPLGRGPPGPVLCPPAALFIRAASPRPGPGERHPLRQHSRSRPLFASRPGPSFAKRTVCQSPALPSSLTCRGPFASRVRGSELAGIRDWLWTC